MQTGVIEQLTLEPAPVQVSVARGFVRRNCRRLGVDADTCETAVLLGSELVTSAFVRGHSKVDILLAAVPGGVRVEVADQNPGDLTVAPRDGKVLAGRGLTILEALASAWGSHASRHGRTVWFSVTATGRV